MSVEDIIKMKTEETVYHLKTQIQSDGTEFTKHDELMFRSGIMHGLAIGAAALSSINGNIILPPLTETVEYKEERWNKWD